jgi:hypothetical protein
MKTKVKTKKKQPFYDFDSLKVMAFITKTSLLRKYGTNIIVMINYTALVSFSFTDNSSKRSS